MNKFEIHPLNPGEGSRVLITAGVIKHPGQLTPFYEIKDPLAAPTITVGSKPPVRWPGNAVMNGGEDFTYDERTGTAGNCRGLPDEGPENLVEFTNPIAELTRRGIRTIFSVTNLPQEKPIEVIPELVEKVLEKTMPTAIEVNLSCPNGLKADGSFHAPLCNDAEASGEVMEAIRDRVGYNVCIGIKDSPHVASIEDATDELQVVKLVEVVAPYIDFATGINTIGNQPFSRLTAGNGRGGMSGPIVAEKAREWLQTWRFHAPSRIAILSCGGVDSYNAHLEIPKRLAMGAMLVGGAQEFYRKKQPHLLAAEWAIAGT